MSDVVAVGPWSKMRDRVVGESIRAADIREGDLVDWWQGSRLRVVSIEQLTSMVRRFHGESGSQLDFAPGCEVILMEACDRSIGDSQ